MKTKLNYSYISLTLVFITGLAGCVAGDDQLDDIDMFSHENSGSKYGVQGAPIGPGYGQAQRLCRGYNLCCDKSENANNPNNLTCHKHRCGTFQGQDLPNGMCTSQCDADEYMADGAFVNGVWTQRVPCSLTRINAGEI